MIGVIQCFITNLRKGTYMRDKFVEIAGKVIGYSLIGTIVCMAVGLMVRAIEFVVRAF